MKKNGFNFSTLQLQTNVIAEDSFETFTPTDILHQHKPDLISKFDKRIKAYELKNPPLGRGRFGVAHLALCLEDNKHYVVKQIFMTGYSRSETEGSIREIEVLSSLQHPYIVGYRESFYSAAEESLYIVMEYCGGGDLGKMITQAAEKNIQFPEEQIITWIAQIALALQHCHHKKILHRDLKCQNIFLDKKGNCKLGDFGIARVLNSTCDMAMSMVGTPFTMSPEICQSQPYSYKSDIWGLGCIIYEICVLQHAYQADNFFGLIHMIVLSAAPRIPSCYSSELSNLVGSMLMKKPEMRPDIDMVINTPIISNEKRQLQLKAQNIQYLRRLKSNKSPLHDHQSFPTIDISTQHEKEEVLTPKQKKEKRLREKELKRKEELKKASMESLKSNKIRRDRMNLERRGHDNITHNTAFGFDDEIDKDKETKLVLNDFPLNNEHQKFDTPPPRPAHSPTLPSSTRSTSNLFNDKIQVPRSISDQTRPVSCPTSKQHILMEDPNEFNLTYPTFETVYSYDDEIDDDFEPLSEDENEEIKLKTLIDDMNKGVTTPLSDIKEETATGERICISIPDKMKLLKEKWICQVGVDKFNIIYNFFKKRCDNSSNEMTTVLTKHYLSNQFGDDSLDLCRAVEQLVVYELTKID